MFFRYTYRKRDHQINKYPIPASITSLIARKEQAPAFPECEGCQLSPIPKKKSHFFPYETVQPTQRKESVLSPIRRYGKRRTSFFTSFPPFYRHTSFYRHASSYRHAASFRHAASLTVEAALELPLFFVLIAIVLQYACVMRTAAQYSGSLTTTAQEMAIAAYKEQYSDANNVLRAALSDAWATTQVIQTAPDKDAVRYASFLNSSYLKEDSMIKLVLSYQPKPKYTPLSLPITFFVQKAAVRGWIGRSGRSGRDRQRESENSESHTVYVTEHGSVFHTNPGCSHLKVTIIPVTKDQLKDARNTSGCKYKKCPYCSGQQSDQYYVDPYGSCFHTSVSCSALKRTVHERDRADCGHLHECKDCRKVRYAD